MDHSSHSHHDHGHHDHGNNEDMVMNHSDHADSMVPHVVMDMANRMMNSSLKSNLSSILETGFQHASETVSNIMGDMTNANHSDHSDHSHTGHSESMSHDNMDDMGHMKMYFHFGYDETILFKGWVINSIIGLVGSMLAIFCLAILYEGLKYFREFLFKKEVLSLKLYAAPKMKGNENCVPTRETPLQYMDQVLLPSTINIWSKSHAIQTLLHMLQFVISYCLMLIFMTYNVWLCLACTLGAGFGYFLFGWKKSVVVDVTEHCH